MKLTNNGVGAQGQPSGFEVIFKPDGKDYPLRGLGPANTTRAYTKVDNHLEYVNKVNGKVTLTGIFLVSQDGKTLTVIQKGATPEGQPFIRLLVHER